MTSLAMSQSVKKELREERGKLAVNIVNTQNAISQLATMVENRMASMIAETRKGRTQDDKS